MNEDSTMTPTPTTDPKAQGKATASLVLGIISLALAWFGYSAIAGLICAVIGTVLGNTAKKAGVPYKAGFVCSIIGIVLNSVCFVACVLFVAVIGTAAALY
ncbi:MAG: hypothetical protein ACQGQO_01900 [Sphaerochaetaceae bacterium]